ncbi:MAG: PAS domain S-box protein, partial [Sphingomonadales bacterium]|nr:PAS domain S-box protein [Sphingomonadales bacterium]
TFNRAAEKMFRYSSDEVLGKNIAVLMTGFDADRHGGYVEGYMETRSKKIIGIGPREVNGVRKDGSLIPIDLAVNEIKGVDKTIFVGSVRDISERIVQRKRIQRSQKIEAIGQLTRGVATDFNNILINIQENLDLLEGKHGRDSQSLEYIQSANKASKHGVEMIQRLLAFSRRQQLTPESINIKDVITDTVKLAEPSLGPKIEVNLDVSRDLWSIVADKGQLENTLLSLCLNSRDAMPSGGVLSIKAENLMLNKEDADKKSVMPGEYIRLCVNDNGIGMTEGIVDKVFQPFFTTKDFGKGSGLGLSIIHSFVHQTGGTIALHSEVDKGTEVEILLPRHGQVSLT